MNDTDLINDLIVQVSAHKSKYNQALKALSEALCNQKIAARYSMEDKSAIANNIYWNLSDVPLENLSTFMGNGNAQFARYYAKPFPTGITCPDCGREIMAKSRAELRDSYDSARNSTGRLVAPRCKRCMAKARLQRRHEIEG